MKRFISTSCLLLGALFVVPAGAGAEELTFAESWQMLLQNNEGLAAERAGVERSEYLVQANKGRRLPTLDLTGSYMRLDDPITVGPTDLLSSMPAGAELEQLFTNIGNLLGIPAGSVDQALTSTLRDDDVWNASLRALWPLFTGGKISAANDIAEAQQMEAEFHLKMEEQVKFEELAKYYFGVVLADRVLETRVEVQDGLAEHLDHAVKMEEQGQVARVERLQAAASHDQALVERRKAERDYEIASLALTRIVRSESPVHPASGLFTNSKLPSEQSFVDSTLAQYPGLGMLDAKRRQANGLIKVNQADYYPGVFVFGNYTFYQGDDLVGKTAPDWMVGVGVKVPLISPSGRRDRVGAARSAVLQVDHLRGQAEHDLQLLVEKTYREALQALEEYEGLATSLELAEENARLRNIAFSQGLSTSLDVIDGQLFLASIKTQRWVAAYRYVLSLARLLAISGGSGDFASFQNSNSSGMGS
ncbi:MAG: TolC family protein [Candidatus Krumholzibacteria bacterium]|nr:TolC family protein [Candidatus Krumholzibacteria bacterium]